MSHMQCGKIKIVNFICISLKWSKGCVDEAFESILAIMLSDSPQTISLDGR